MPIVIDHLTLQFENNDRFHNDLVLRVGPETCRCDSYYLLLDNRILPGKEDAEKVSVVLNRLLVQWREAVEYLPEAGTCFLPFDFSDQYTAWLRCEARGPDLLVQRGWAEIEGWRVLPSDIGELLRDVPGFHPEGPLYQIQRQRFLRSLSTPQDHV
jgi:hypothetical protein